MKLKSIALLAALAAAPVFAQAPPAGGGPSPEVRAALEAMRTACANDQKTLCDGKQGREVNQCLRANTDKLSAGCKDAMAKMPRPQRPAN